MLNFLNKINSRLEFLLYKLYFRIKNIYFIKFYLNNIRNIIEITNPTQEYYIITETMKLMVISNSIAIIIFIMAISLKGTTIYNVAMIFSLIYIFQLQIIYSNVEKREYKLLKQLEKYLGEVRHYYHCREIIEEAICDSLEEVDKELSPHIEKIYELLMQDDFYEIIKYKEISPNKFLTTFLALCQVILTYGDTIYEKQSLFLTNINTLRNEINIEILKREKIKHTFSGLIFITILPVFFLKAIENWSISNLAELEKYYYGAYGIIVSTLIFITTIIVYSLVNKLKDSGNLYRKQHTILDGISNIKIVNKGINYIIYYMPVKCRRIDGLLKKISEGITLKQFIVQKILIFISSIMITTFIIINIIFASKQNEIYDRILNYQSYNYDWYYMVLTILFAYILSKIPYFILLCKKQLLQMSMEDEVMQYHSIIIMLMHIKRMNVETILEWLENFSEIFKPSIIECVDNYSYDEEYALNKIKEDEPFLPFVRIIENLEACDKQSIEEAFDEIVSQRSFFLEKRKQDNEIILTNKGVIGKVLAYIPIMMTLLLYLILPFILESVTNLLEFIKQLQEI